MATRAVLIFGIVSLCASCAVWFPTDVDDLRFEGVEHVRRTSLKTQHHLGPQGWEQYASYLRIDFSTAIDLAASAERSELNLWLITNYCPMPDFWNGRSEIDAVGPYYQDVKLPHWYGDEARYRAIISEHPAGSRYVYSAYFIPKMPRRKYLNHTEPPLPSYDLAGPQANVCLLVGGGNMVMGHFRSNVIVIPREALVQAMGQVPK